MMICTTELTMEKNEQIKTFRFATVRYGDESKP